MTELMNSFQAVNPATGETLPGRFTDASTDEIDQVMMSAAAAHRELRTVTRLERAEFLEAVADNLEQLGAELIERASQETGLPQPRIEGERGRTVGQLRMFAALIRKPDYLGVHKDAAEPDRKPIPKPDLRLTHRPLGPVVVFGASNFPLAYSVAGGDTASALAAGCPVVVKAHPAHPGTSELVAKAVRHAVKSCGMPEGTFGVVHGKSTQVGRSLVEHPATRAVGFTGSLTAGRALFDIAARRPTPIPVFAEMGSTNPLFMLPERMAETGGKLAEDLSASVSLGVGQFCTNPGLVFAVDDENSREFVNALGRIFSGLAEGVMLHAGIKTNWVSGLRKQMNTDGVSVAGQATGSESSDTLANPTVLSCSGRTFLKHNHLQDEVFGPSTLVVLCRDSDELLACAESLQGQLTAGIHGTAKDMQDFDDLQFLLEERAGRLIFGGYPTGVEVCTAMEHGGPYPATTDSRFTAVGSRAIARFLRPISYQNASQDRLPEELRD